MAICIQPDLRPGEALCSRRASDRPRHSVVSAHRFHDSMVRRLRCEASHRPFDFNRMLGISDDYDFYPELPFRSSTERPFPKN
jgi:hypothetical protein